MNNNKLKGDLVSNSFISGKLSGDLSLNGRSNNIFGTGSYFNSASNFSTINIENNVSSGYTETEMREYLASIVSGKRYEGATADGRMFTSFERVVNMVEDGDNIIDATYYNPDMIEIEFQRFEKNLNEMKGKML